VTDRLKNLKNPIRYAAYYCEENIFHLARERGNPDDRVLLISNTRRQAALAAQKAGRGEEGIVVWDYHVVLAETSDPARIFDFDSRLGPAADLRVYLDATFPQGLYALNPALEPVISVITGNDYVRNLSSDRSHMKSPDGRYLKKRPPWPEIFNPERGNTLFALVDGTHPAVLHVLTLEEFRLRYQ
jgi:hypothetical protein